MEKEFEWTSELALRFAKEYRASSSRTSIERFIKDETERLKEEEKPTVNTWCMSGSDIQFFIYSKSEKPFTISRDRLSEILIAESKGELLRITHKSNDGITATRDVSDDKKIYRKRVSTIWRRLFQGS